MKFYSQHEAKQFFIDKIISYAEDNNIPLSEAETYMLQWIEVEDGFTVDSDMIDEFDAETTDEEFEQKIQDIILNAYNQDINADSSKKQIYKEAYATLEGHDYYIMDMIEESIGSRLRKWWKFSWY